MNLGKKCAQYAAAIIRSSKVTLLVRNTLDPAQPTALLPCMPQQMKLDAVALLKAEGTINAAAPNPTRFLFLPSAAIKGVPVAGNWEVEYDGYVWQLLDGGARDPMGVTAYRVFIGTRSRGIA
jgi:hypothetical protein